VDGVLEVAGGRVQGGQRAGVWAFSGIPYARAPVGSLRWRAPEPPEPWAGVREALEFGPIAPQPAPVTGLSVPGDPVDQSEDCLSLNVWTPAPDDKGRPVMVWVHGGGFTSGTGASGLTRGGELARRGDVVVVTCNYRLGALGFLAHPSLTDGGAGEGAVGNWGLLDQMAALRWVQEHIARFGGDPDNVTIFGESAGSMSISALLAIPAARGLFHRAVLQSGPPYAHSLERAALVTEHLAEELGLLQITRHALESVPAPLLVQAAQRLQDRPPRPGELPLPFLPVVDGVALPSHPQEAVANGRGAGVPLLIGTNRDEVGFFVLGDPRLQVMNDEALDRWVRRAVPDLPVDEVIAAYRAARRGRGETVSPHDILVAVGSDRIFRWPSLALAAAQRSQLRDAFVYLFTWETPAFGGSLGSCHALEIPFVFGSVHRPMIAAFTGGGPEAEALSARMQGAWLSFARTGDPSHEGIGIWPSWDRDSRATMVFGKESAIVHGPRNEELAVWERVSPLAGDAPQATA
jgi:para-nitrobenzyl esterase